MSVDIVPKDLKNLRACLVCSLIKSGCEWRDVIRNESQQRESLVHLANFFFFIKDENASQVAEIVNVPILPQAVTCNFGSNDFVEGFLDVNDGSLRCRLVVENIDKITEMGEDEGTLDQFEMDGCDNCDEFLRMKNNRENVYDCTSSNFDGMIALMSPEDSWVAKWQRINRFVKGIYAISVAGRLPAHFIRDMKNRGIVYRPRDMSQR